MVGWIRIRWQEFYILHIRKTSKFVFARWMAMRLRRFVGDEQDRAWYVVNECADALEKYIRDERRAQKNFPPSTP